MDILYNRTELEFKRGTFRVKGDTVDIFLAYADYAIRIYFWGDEIESIQRIDPINGKKISDEKVVTIFPANLFVTGQESFHVAIHEIQEDMVAQVGMFEGRVETSGSETFKGANRIRSRDDARTRLLLRH